MLLRLVLFIFLTLPFAGCNKNDDPPANNPPPVDRPVVITSKVLASDLQLPWEILWGPDNMIWMTERIGRISRVNPATGAVTPIATIDEVDSRGEDGMLGMVLYPTVSQPTHLYVAYSYDKSGTYTNKIVRYEYLDDAISNPVVIIDDLLAANIHNGCRMAISQDEKLFITMGDAADQSTPQDLSSRNGKVLRVNLDGTIPADNPDPASAVWSIGHRNAQGLVFVNDVLFSSEHGPDSDDEINIITKGANYGWPDVRGDCNNASEQSFCDANDITEPIINWTPTIAVCGIDYYNSDSIPQWRNSLLMCTLKGSTLYQLKLSGNLQAVDSVGLFLNNEYGRLRDVCVAPDGRVFVCTSNGGNQDVIIEVKGEKQQQ